MAPRKNRSSASNISIPTALHMTPHPGQMRIMDSRARFRVVACGRRFGKTEVGKWLILEAAMHGADCWWLAPTYRMAQQVWRDLRRACRAFPRLQVSQAEMRIDGIENGARRGSISVRSAHLPDLLRGAGLDLVVLDEAAYIADGVWREVVRPMLLERQGGALFLSTPCGRNSFYELYLQASAGDSPDWQAFHFTSYDNPLIDRAELEAVRAQTPEAVFRAEYMAEFIDDAGAVFRGVRQAATAPAGVPRPGARIVGGIDWGRHRDYTVVTLIDVEAQAVVAVERFHQLGWALQRGRIAALCAQWQPALLWGEENSIGGANIEALQAEGLPVRPFRMTAVSKTPLIEALALALERGELRLLQPDAPNGEVVLRELAAFTQTRLPGGGVRFSAPAGLHDDCVISLALAWHGLRASGPGIAWA